MKKFISMILILVLSIAATFAFAEGVDVSSMTDEELRAIVDSARNELVKRELTAEADTVLFDAEGVKMYLTGNSRVSSDGEYAYFEVVVVNDTDVEVGITVESASINGWDVFGSDVYGTSAGKKQKAEMFFKIADAEISTIEEIDDLELTFRLFDSDNSTFITEESDPVILNVNG